MTPARYGVAPRREDFPRRVEQLVLEKGCRTICDVGGGANPVLSAQFIAAHGLRYLVADSSEAQLALAPDRYDKLVLDMTAEGFRAPVACDLVLSRYVLEHIPAPEAFHANVRRLLVDGGRAAHFFSTLYGLPFVVNRLAPDAFASRVAALSIPERETGGREPVFPAFYRWCRGPSRRQMRRLERLGFEIEEYVGYFGHSYFRRLPRLQRLEYRAARALVRRPVPALTSFAQVVLVKRP